MKKQLSLICVLSIVLSMFGCSQTSSTEKTYSATSQGIGGDITIDVTLQDNQIKDIQITSENESAGVGEEALSIMKEKVLSNQSFNVDTVSGATISSNAFLSAIKDVLLQANLENSFSKEVEIETKDETYDYDVVVVGSGISGLCAGLNAAKLGAKVAIVEKLGIVGGTSIFSSGIFLMAKEEETIDKTKNIWLSRNKIQDQNQVDENKVDSMLSSSPDLMKMILDTGITYEIKEDSYFYPDASDKAIQNANGIHLATATTKQKGGENLLKYLKNAFLDAGGDIYVDTPVTSLIQDEEKSITGVISESKFGTKTYNAKSVILATGDYAQNKEMEEELCETAVGNYTATAIGNTGDGITMALEVGAVLDDFQESMSGIFAPDPYDMPVVGQPYNSYPYECLLLNTKGERKISETAGTHDQMIYFVNDGEADYGWVIMDQEIADQFLNLDEYLDKTTSSSVIQAYKETSIDALADDIGMSKEVLEDAIDRYNSMCDNQKDTDCGKDSQYLSAIDDGTYYAVKEYNCTRGNYGGILTNENAEVIDQDGNAISGLYAAGIISSGSYFGDYYPGCEALAVGAHMGYIAGKNAYSYSQQ